MTSLKHRTLTSSIYSVGALGLQAVIVLGRSIILARLLEPEIFGIYALALSVTSVTLAFANAGLSGPLLYHSPESSGDVGASTHFTLNLTLSSLWAILLTCFTIAFVDPSRRLVFGTLVVSSFVQQLTLTQQILLQKHVLFKRIAVNQAVTSLATAFVAVLLASHGYGIWSLLSINILATVITVIMYNIVRPFWKVHIAWHPKSVRYFLRFGSWTFVAGVLGIALDHIDNLWTGYALGSIALGFYSKAYEFATYPRNLIARPLDGVAAGTYAELHKDRQRLSRVFIVYNSLLIRLGFAIAGGLAIIAPEFISLVIGAKWLPMLDVFRLMLAFTMFDPIRIAIASVLVAVGKPEQVGIARGFQLVVLLVGLFVLGSRWDILGVAVAVDIMLLAGIGLMLYFAAKHVDFSLWQLFGVPLLGLIIGMGLGTWIPILLHMPNFAVSIAITKIVTFCVCYFIVLVLFERRLLLDFLNSMTTILREVSLA